MTEEKTIRVKFDDEFDFCYKLSLPFLIWLGGADYVYNQPGYGFLDGLFWLYYVGRFVAQHFTALTPMAG